MLFGAVFGRSLSQKEFPIGANLWAVAEGAGQPSKLSPVIPG
jgi:hypothetical protein